MHLQFLILIALAVAAAIFSVLTAIVVVIRKTIDRNRAKTQVRLYQIYAARCSELLLTDLPLLPADSKPSSLFLQYESLIEPIKRSLVGMVATRRRAHREALRQVLVDCAQDISGDSSRRLVYFFYSFGFVDEELRLIKSRRWWIRANAARTLGLLGAKKAIAALTALLEDPHPDVRHQAMQSLVKLVGPDALRTILRISRNLSRWTAIELSVVVSSFKGTAIPYLIEALKSRDQSVVLFAAEMLAEIGFVTAVEPLMHLIRTTIDTTIQAQSLKTLGRLGDERPRDLVVELLKSKVQLVRLSAMEALGRISGREAIEMLKPWLASRLHAEKLVAARALATTGADGIAILRAVGTDNDELTVAIANQVLEEFGVETEEA